MLSLNHKVVKELVDLKLVGKDFDHIVRYLDSRYCRKLTEVEAQIILGSRIQGQDESIQDNAADVQKLVYTAFPSASESQTLFYFTNGIRNIHVKRDLLKSRLDSIWDAVEAASRAQSVEDSLGDDGRANICAMTRTNQSPESQKIQILENKIEPFNQELSELRIRN
ncbi:hypothetical protein RF11_14731 [Thelohanellus kitauei]|uniref:Uncharacterized protein n=1 Tax=Thelohanellus kitauei TaxID=669202 RepID=A0A0C2MPM0_THEKT|nr:hypothetical protein RF11_14731 [Thelohanellus kitauei]